MAKPKNYEILGIGNPFMDYILHVSEDFLQTVTSIKGGVELIEHDHFQKLIKDSGKIPKLIAGGSGTNAIKGLAHLGEKCALVGKIGSDEAGETFRESMTELGITPLYEKSTTPTGQVLCFVTPDGERTMRSYLGASAEVSAGDLNKSYFEGVRLVHVEGYTILRETYAGDAMEMAKAASAQVSFDLANFEIVQDYKEVFLHLLETYVDIVFANEKEIHALTNLLPEEGCRYLSQLCDIAIILRGKKGCLVGHKDHVTEHPAFVVEHPLDTTGAGDLFASGFLHGYMSGKSLDLCARMGALVAAEVVQNDGAEIPPKSWEGIKVRIEDIT